MTNREFFIHRWEAEFPAMIRVFRALPAGKLDYRPHPRSRSAAELVSLLVYEERTGIELCDSGEIHWQEPQPSNDLDRLIEKYEQYHKELAARLSKLDDAAWNRRAQFFIGDQGVLEGTVGEMLWVALFDAIHHRGQLSVYIRPMGGKVPSIYGPSADERDM